MESQHLPASLEHAIEAVKRALPNSSDLVIRVLHRQSLGILFVNTMIDADCLQRSVLAPLQRYHNKITSLQALREIVPIGNILVEEELQQVITQMLRGWVYLHLHGHSKALLVQVEQLPKGLPPEREYTVIGQQIAFTENVDNNVTLLRKLLPDVTLNNEAMVISRRSKTRLQMVFIHDIASEQNVQTLRQRLQEIEIDSVTSSTVLTHLIEDNSYSLFSQLLLTERPDRVIYDLLEGKIALLLDGSSLAVLAPCTIWDFLKTSEDYNTRWNIAFFIRVLRMVAMFSSTILTAIYVAALTYHYQVIPVNLLDSLIESRLRVPFPPLYEALLLETIIELLREAGARLPTKVGQTMGIVGGIVIGEAAVQAGFTSNILIMLVALGALSSFTSPNYMFGMVIRLLRFPMIILAGWLGGLGIALGIGFLFLHLLRQTSLGHPYLWPLYPLRIKFWQEALLRLRMPSYSTRTAYARPADKKRFSSHKAKQKQDIDE